MKAFVEIMVEGETEGALRDELENVFRRAAARMMDGGRPVHGTLHDQWGCPVGQIVIEHDGSVLATSVDNVAWNNAEAELTRLLDRRGRSGDTPFEFVEALIEPGSFPRISDMPEVVADQITLDMRALVKARAIARELMEPLDDAMTRGSLVAELVSVLLGAAPSTKKG